MRPLSIPQLSSNDRTLLPPQTNSISYTDHTLDHVLTLDSARKDELPEGGYGWICVACMFMITAMTWGVNGAFGVYLTHYIDTDSFSGTKELTYAFVGGVSVSQTTFIAPLVTKCTRSFGTRTTLCIGVVLETVGLVAASFATRTWQLFLSQGLCFGWGCSFLYVGAIPIIPQWFSKRRTFANAIAAAGSGLGGLVWSLATDSMIRHIGLSWAFRITAICVFVVNGIGAALIKDRNEMAKPDQKIFDLSLLKRVEYLLLIGWSFLSTFGYTVVLVSLPSNAISIGLTTQQGAVTGALVNLGMAIGRTIVGYLSDSLGRVNVAGVATFLCAIFCFGIWTSASTYGQLLAFAVFGGTVCGTYWATIGPLLVDVMGLRVLPAALSLVWVSIAVPTAFAEAIALELRRVSKPIYRNAGLLAGALFTAAAVLMMILRAWKVGSERKDMRFGADRETVADEAAAGECIVDFTNPLSICGLCKVWRV